MLDPALALAVADKNSGRGESCIPDRSSLSRVRSAASRPMMAPGRSQGDGCLELGGLTNLQWLALHSNQLTGEIPEELGGLTRLQQLSLGYQADWCDFAR